MAQTNAIVKIYAHKGDYFMEIEHFSTRTLIINIKTKKVYYLDGWSQTDGTILRIATNWIGKMPYISSAGRSIHFVPDSDKNEPKFASLNERCDYDETKALVKKIGFITAKKHMKEQKGIYKFF